MAKQFDLLTGSINLSPLDFNYQFGLNNNDSQYFNYTDTTLMTNALTQVTSQMLPIVSAFSDLLPFQEDTVVGYEVSSVPLQTISYSPSLAFDKLEKLDTSVSMSDMYSSIINSSIDYISGMLNILGSGGKSEADQGFQLAMAVLDLAETAVSMGFSIDTAKKTLSDYKGYVNKQIELYNEKADANREFIQQCNEMIKKRQERFEKSNRVINGKTK